MWYPEEYGAFCKHTALCAGLKGNVAGGHSVVSFIKCCAPPDEVMGSCRVSQEPFYDDSVTMQQMEGRLCGNGMSAVT